MPFCSYFDSLIDDIMDQSCISFKNVGMGLGDHLHMGSGSLNDCKGFDAAFSHIIIFSSR